MHSLRSLLPIILTLLVACDGGFGNNVYVDAVELHNERHLPYVGRGLTIGQSRTPVEAVIAPASRINDIAGCMSERVRAYGDQETSEQVRLFTQVYAEGSEPDQFTPEQLWQADEGQRIVQNLVYTCMGEVVPVAELQAEQRRLESASGRGQ